MFDRHQLDDHHVVVAGRATVLPVVVTQPETSFRVEDADGTLLSRGGAPRR
jgi:hypothetical protein